MSLNDNRGRTVYIGSLPSEVTEDLLWEIFLQVGPIEDVSIVEAKSDSPAEGSPCDRRFAFVIYEHEESVLFACKMMHDVTLFGQKIIIKPRKNTESDRIWHRIRHSMNSTPIFKRDPSVERYVARSTSDITILTPPPGPPLLTPPTRSSILPAPAVVPILMPCRPPMTPTN
uniref:RRM domain-containing protein n=1 Tax=Panagrolaimus sp. JU765 TaxID=591449 RepID=A0AC34RNB8_9BILA